MRQKAEIIRTDSQKAPKVAATPEATVAPAMPAAVAVLITPVATAANVFHVEKDLFSVEWIGM